MSDKKRYLVALVITAAIFITAFLASDYLNSRRLEEIRALQEGVTTDILSLEAQFDLFERHLSCSNLTQNTVLSEKLSDLASRLTNAEKNLGVDNEEVLRLKRSYTLLQIKDYVLMNRIAERCGSGPAFILYFYSNEKGACPDCEKQGFVLSAISEEFPKDARVYAFDYNLKLGVLETLISLNRIEKKFPSLLINGVVRYGFRDKEAIEKLIPRLKKIQAERDASEKNSAGE